MPSVLERSNKLLHLISTIYTALLELVTIASAQSNTEPRPFLPLPLKVYNNSSTSISAGRHRQKSMNSDKSTPQRSERDISRLHSAQHTSSGGTVVMPSTPMKSAVEWLGPIAEGVLLHFCEITLDTVKKMIFCSHDRFNDTLWSASSEISPVPSVSPGGNGYDKKGTRVVSFDVPDSPEKVDTLAEVVRRQDGRELQTKFSNLASSLYRR